MTNSPAFPNPATELAALRQRVAQLEQELADSRHEAERLRMIIEQIPVMVDAIDTEGKIALWNRECERVTGYTAEEIVDNPHALAMLYPDPDYLQYMLQRWAEIGNNYRDFIWNITCKDGSIHTISWSNISEQFPVPTWQTWAIGIDVTEQHRQRTELLQFVSLIESSSDFVGIATLDGQMRYLNQPGRRLAGLADEVAIQQMQISEFFIPEEYTRIQQEMLPGTMREGRWRGESQFRHFQHDEPLPVEVHLFLIYDTERDKPTAIATITRDLTEQKRQEAERIALQQQVIDAQRDTLRELSTPLIPITDTVVIMPLIGAIDSQRAQMIMEALLEGVASHRAELAILDITGVAVVDTQVAQALVSTAQAVKLLGAQVMLTGIQPQIAQTLVHLGVDLRGIATQGSLQAGIAAALGRKKLATQPDVWQAHKR